MTTPIKTVLGDTDPNNQDTTSTTNNCNNSHATEINTTISPSALETLVGTNYDNSTSTQLATNRNIILGTDLVRVPSMPDDSAISAVLAPLLDDLRHQDTDVATTNSNRERVSKRVFKANKTGETYTVTNVLGEGVYKVVDRLGDHCVVKAPKETLSDSQIQQEIEHLIKLRGHRNIVQYFGVVNDSDGMYLRQELCLPKNLASLMDKRKFLTEPEVRYFGKQIIEGVRAIHRNKIIHRDLNPGNILVGEGMVLKISSFGSSIPKSQKSTGFIGSVGFVAPEVVKKEEHTTGMDIFSLGIIMYMMFNCKQPHITDEHQVYPPPGKFFKKIRGSKDARDFIQRALKIDPNQRALLMDLAFHEFLKDELCPTTLPESVFVAAPVLEDIIYCSKKRDGKKRKAGEIGGVDEEAPIAGGLSGEEKRQKVSDPVALRDMNKRRGLDDFTDKEKMEWHLKNIKAREQELKDWWKMTNERMRIDLKIPSDNVGPQLRLSEDVNLTLT
ncbi:hypothetical protein BGZ90_004104 [Linnemannia elongata]|nr:hypothetical protein BGZ90_004104 [Linnemannia elongata]